MSSKKDQSKIDASLMYIGIEKPDLWDVASQEVRQNELMKLSKKKATARASREFSKFISQRAIGSIKTKSLRKQSQRAERKRINKAQASDAALDYIFNDLQGGHGSLSIPAASAVVFQRKDPPNMQAVS